MSRLKPSYLHHLMSGLLWCHPPWGHQWNSEKLGCQGSYPSPNPGNTSPPPSNSCTGSPSNTIEPSTFILTCRSLHALVPQSLPDLLHVHYPSQSLWSVNLGLLCILCISRCTFWHLGLIQISVEERLVLSGLHLLNLLSCCILVIVKHPWVSWKELYTSKLFLLLLL